MRYLDLIYASLENGDTSPAPLEIELMVCSAFAISRGRYWTIRNEIITDPTGLRRFRRLLDRRLRGEPLAHILGVREFYSRDFLVNRHCLIPRPETEILVEQALARGRPQDRVLEIGAGSGCVAITLALEQGLHVTALEISRRARRVLKRNILRHGVGGRVSVRAGSLFPPPGPRFDLILSNPPYLSRTEWEELPVEIRGYEPAKALVAGATGMELLAEIVHRASAYMATGGWLLLETGWKQARDVARAMADHGFSSISVHPDLAGIERVVAGQR